MAAKMPEDTDLHSYSFIIFSELFGENNGIHVSSGKLWAQQVVR